MYQELNIDNSFGINTPSGSWSRSIRGEIVGQVYYRNDISIILGPEASTTPPETDAVFQTSDESITIKEITEFKKEIQDIKNEIRNLKLENEELKKEIFKLKL